MFFLRENDRRHHFKTKVFMVFLRENDTQHYFKNNLFKMYKTYQATKLAVFELKMLLFIMMTEELNWELPPEFRGILEH